MQCCASASESQLNATSNQRGDQRLGREKLIKTLSDPNKSSSSRGLPQIKTPLQLSLTVLE